MEGMASIVDCERCRPGSPGYPIDCELLPTELNAAIRRPVGFVATTYSTRQESGR